MYSFMNITSKKSIQFNFLINLNSIYTGKGKVFGLSLTMIFLFQQDFSFAK